MDSSNLINKEEVKRLFKEKKLCTQEDVEDAVKGVSKYILETLLEGEFDAFLGYDKHDSKNKTTDNSRNGYSSKRVKSTLGEMEIETPRDRQSEFEPIIVPKHKREVLKIDDRIISMFARGMTTRDIQAHMEEIYGYTFSPEQISKITDRVMEKAREWQSRPLQSIYPIVFLDGVYFKTRWDGEVKNIAVYGAIGIDIDGNKECLGLWIAETESSKYWLGVLNELKSRGVNDIFIFAIDGLTGLEEAIASSFPKSEVQGCIVHQIRNSLKYVSYKDYKEVVKDLKKIYRADSEESASFELEVFEEKWGKKYPHIYKSWKTHWNRLSTFFKYPEEIRRLIYTTNPIESFNRGLRKVTKNRGLFPNSDSLFKLLYLAVMNISKKWTGQLRNWPAIYSQLCIFFEGRLGRN